MDGNEVVGALVSKVSYTYLDVISTPSLYSLSLYIILKGNTFTLYLSTISLVMSLALSVIKAIFSIFITPISVLLLLYISNEYIINSDISEVIILYAILLNLIIFY